jgi:hypothetical protein
MAGLMDVATPGPIAKPPLSVSFHNFWSRFRAKDSFFVRALEQSFQVSIDALGRDLQISSVFGRDELKSPNGARPLRVWWTGEVIDPQGQFFDLYFGSRPRTSLMGKRWFRYPLWITYLDWWKPDGPYSVNRLKAPRQWGERPHFCNFIYSNPASIRTEFFLRLNEARHVDSWGRVANNAGSIAPGRDGKMQTLADYTFTIAFENQIASGYVTEKLLEPLLAGSIPVYWGAPEARTDFNPEAFIFADDYDGFDDLIAHLNRLSDSSEEVARLATASPLPAGGIAYEHTPGFFADRIKEQLSGAATPLVPDRYRSIFVTPTAKFGRRVEHRLRKVRNAIRGWL